MTTKTRKGRGRPEHVPTKKTRDHVALLASVGNGQETIARVIGISVPTLTRHYASELELGLANANAKVGANLLKQACKDDFRAVPAAIAWLKYRDRHNWNEHGPLPPSMRDQQEQKPAKQAKLGKKQERAIAARNPDESTTMGALMARRAASTH